MENIFKNAYFGKAYKTRDGRKAIYIKSFRDMHFLLTEEDERIYISNEGTIYSEPISKKDVISEWKEEINEEELTYEEFELWLDANVLFIKENKYPLDRAAFITGFKAGYRKAKEKKL